MPKQEEKNLIKPIIVISLLVGIFVLSGAVISAYPQHIWINNKTVIEATVGNFDRGHVNIRGNQVQYTTGDIIFLEGKDYIRITGNQVQFGDNIFTGAIRSLSSDISQNVLFEQKIGTFDINNSVGKVIIDDIIINIIPITTNVMNIKTPDSDYNIELVSDTSYIKSKSIMLKLVRNNNKIDIYLIGTVRYNKILFVKI